MAGLIQLPANLGNGTHVLRLTGAESAAPAEISFPVRSEPEPVLAAAQAPVDDGPGTSPSAWVFLGLAALVLLVSVLLAIRTRRRRTAGRVPDEPEPAQSTSLGEHPTPAGGQA